MSPKPKLSFLVVRVTNEMHSKFHAKAKKFGIPSDVLREFIEAFLEDRLTIVPPVKRKESLYVARKQD
jgi:hypothetical protein